MRARWTCPGLVVAAAMCGVAASARADDLTELLKGGPVVRLEYSDKGKVKRVTAVADVYAPRQHTWDVLNAQEKYKEYMPRIKRVSVRPEGPDSKLVSYVLDTPFVDTSYTLRWKEEPGFKMVCTQVSGDLRGSSYAWRMEELGPEHTRVFFEGITAGYSSIAQRFEDDQQTITVGINVVTQLVTVKSIKQRAEQYHRQGLTAQGKPAPTTPPAAVPVAAGPAPAADPPAVSPPSAP